MTNSNIRLGIDLGGTKIEIVAIDDRSKIHHRQRISTRSQSYTDILDDIQNLVIDSEKALDVYNCSVGVGIPGALSKKTGLVKNANTQVLIGHAFDQDLSERLNRPVRVANDANCFALSEAIDGAAQGAESVFGVILGTGVGGALVHKGEILSGRNAIAGEWGHNPLPWAEETDLPKQACYCGQHGCIETYLSGPGMSQQALLQHGQRRDSQAWLTEQGPVYQQYCLRLARSLATVINVFDPDVIVLGGGLSNIDALYIDVPMLWDAFTFSDTIDTKLVKNLHGDSSGVRGAAWLCS